MEDETRLSDHGESKDTQQLEKEMRTTQGHVSDAQKRGGFGGNLRDVPFAAANADGSSKLTRETDKAGGREGTPRGSRMTEALQRSGRKRKGSLRQGILGKNLLSRGPQENQRTSTKPLTTDTNMTETTPDEETTPRPSNFEKAAREPTFDCAWTSSPSTTRSSSYELDQQDSDASAAAAVATLAAPYASTTDDDETASLYTPSASNASSYNTTSFQASAATSLPRRRSNQVPQHTSLSTVQLPTDLALDEEWDYSETEWWGWIILIVTWTVFVVGMGSCLGVWSWAWDVGETPYAPPELEDDPTLPITGYYPALMVCTAVMAWVWVVVAWVGMKYFRHAKMVGDD